MDMQHPSPRSKLHDYEVGAVLDRCAHGVLYHGVDSNQHCAVTIKEYFPLGYAVRDGHSGDVSPVSLDLTEDYRQGLQNFINETRALTKLRQTNIVRVRKVVEANGTAYRVMDSVEGTTLRALDPATLRWTEHELLSLAQGLLAGLETIHEAGLLHHDLNPGNVIVSSDGRPIVIEFGSAGHTSRSTGHRVVEMVAPGFTPFESYGDHRTGDHRGPSSDIYSVAAVLYRLASGVNPADAMARANALLSGNGDCLRPLSEAADASLPRSLSSAIDIGLAFRAADRPQAIAQWRSILPPLPEEQTALALLKKKLFPCQSPAPTIADTSRPVSSPVPVAVPDDARTTTQHSSTRSAAGSFESLRVLLVDDEPAIRGLLARILKRSGISHIIQAGNANEALAQLDQALEPVDIIFSDLNMPGIDGIEFLRHLAKRNLGAGIILVSGQDQRILQSAFTLAESHSLYVLGTITKPFVPSAVHEFISLYERERAPAPTRTPAADDLSLEELREGIHTGCLTAFYQPKVEVLTGRTVGVEALARWRRPNGQMVMPGSFIDLAESNGLIDELTQAVFSQAVEEGARWQAAGLNLQISVNFSVRTLNRYDLPEFILGQVAHAGLNPGLVTLEVTESSMMNDLKTPLEILTRLRLREVGLSIDDFGTGHASMERIKSIPFTEIKIDRSFVNGATRDPSARAILESSANLGKSLGLRLVAEGVETQAEWDLVASCGCHEVQGFLLARPMPAAEIIPFIECRGFN